MSAAARRDLLEAGVEVAPQHRVRFAGLQLPRLQALPQLLRDHQTLLQIQQRLGAEVELARLRIEAGERLLVGREREQRIGRAARGDPHQFLGFVAFGSGL